MRYVRVDRPWVTILARRRGSTASPDTATNDTARIASFQRAEAGTGLLVGIGSIAVAVPGAVTRLPPASALLALPIVALVAYGVLILRRDAATPLQPDERRLIRRRTIGWGAVTLVAFAFPLDWVLPLFIAGWITLAYATYQLRQQRRL